MMKRMTMTNSQVLLTLSKKQTSKIVLLRKWKSSFKSQSKVQLVKLNLCLKCQFQKLTRSKRLKIYSESCLESSLRIFCQKVNVVVCKEHPVSKNNNQLELSRTHSTAKIQGLTGKIALSSGIKCKPHLEQLPAFRSQASISSNPLL